jgi:hypothetical protein
MAAQISSQNPYARTSHASCATTPVIGLPELEEGKPEFLDGAEGPDPQEVLLQRPDEPLGAAVALGGADKGRGR